MEYQSLPFWLAPKPDLKYYISGVWSPEKALYVENIDDPLIPSTQFWLLEAENYHTRKHTAYSIGVEVFELLYDLISMEIHFGKDIFSPIVRFLPDAIISAPRNASYAK